MSALSCENEVIGILRPSTGGTVELREGAQFSVGSDADSEICLTGEGIAAIHCMISVSGGVVSVQDCYSEVGTIVGGERIRNTELTDGTEICIGSAQIAVTLHKQEPAETERGESFSGRSPAQVETSDIRKEPLDTFEADQEPVAAEPEPSTPDGPSPLEQIENLQLQLDTANAEIDVLRNRLAETAPTAAAAESDPYQEEMIELLRAEVMDLQAMLAERDDSVSVSNQSPSADDVLPQDEAERLVERLEQLLAELQQRDEQIATLTQLLDATEESCRAERDEREQLAEWLKDIEERFGSREQEWEVERRQLKEAADTMAAQRDSAEQAMNADTSNAKLEAAQNLLLSLRREAESQRQKLAESEETIEQLRRELEEAAGEQVREEMMQLAEERAELARQRQELESERQREQQSSVREADLKLRALKQHLNEIHEQEQKEKQERKLSSRIARLWSRMDGR